MKKLVLLTALLVSGPAFAAANDAPADGKKKDKMICRDFGETGSRLSKKRICMTAAQWVEHRRQTQSDIDRAQTQQVNKQGS
jgi:hypothetical protein